MSGSGHADERSRANAANINALGCQVDESKGDVSISEDVRHAFRESSVPIGGVIQGAMVFRVSVVLLHAPT
jgi:KR domain